MSQVSRRLQTAIEAVRTLSPEQQDLVAVEMMARVRALSRPPTRLTAQERAELEAELVAARRGEFATDDEVAAMYAKYGL